MIVLCLIACIIPRAFSAQGKVVPNFNECKEFFYNGIEPSGMDQNAMKICQTLENSEGFYYASLYSESCNIPLYSAYTLDPACRIDSSSQISQLPSFLKDTRYDYGFLNPSSFQCGDGRTATYTRTNIAPVDTCFKRDHWSKWERTLRGYLLKELVRDDDFAKAFIVTGTVPNPNEQIPNTNITVPSHIWTAVCYKHNSDDNKSFSFGYIGRNQPVDPDIRLMSVSDLNDELGRLYLESVGYFRRNMRVKSFVLIFKDACFSDDYKLQNVKDEFQKLMNLSVYQAVQMSSSIRETHLPVNRDVSSDGTYANISSIRVSEMAVRLAFDSMSTYFNVAEDLKVVAGSACLITYARPVAWQQSELENMTVSMGPDAVECLLVPEKQNIAADGSRCSGISESHYKCQCNTGGETKPCCSSPCLYQNKLNGYRCYSDQKLIECSPPYSFITYEGERCLDDCPCATYGKDYYSCKITTDSWKYCSPPLWNSKTINGQYCRSNCACAKYGSEKTWCYTDEKGKNYDKCCTSDDCYSAVNGQICRDNHPCGYYDENYLWCYTDYYNNWNYCCTNCSQ